MSFSMFRIMKTERAIQFTVVYNAPRPAPRREWVFKIFLPLGKLPYNLLWPGTTLSGSKFWLIQTPCKPRIAFEFMKIAEPQL